MGCCSQQYLCVCAPSYGCFHARLGSFMLVMYILKRCCCSWGRATGGMAVMISRGKLCMLCGQLGCKWLLEQEGGKRKMREVQCWCSRDGKYMIHQTLPWAGTPVVALAGLFVPTRPQGKEGKNSNCVGSLCWIPSKVC
jgi:hypothetical protein